MKHARLFGAALLAAGLGFVQPASAESWTATTYTRTGPVDSVGHASKAACEAWLDGMVKGATDDARRAKDTAKKAEWLHLADVIANRSVCAPALPMPQVKDWQREQMKLNNQMLREQIEMLKASPYPR